MKRKFDKNQRRRRVVHFDAENNMNQQRRGSRNVYTPSKSRLPKFGADVPGDAGSTGNNRGSRGPAKGIHRRAFGSSNNDDDDSHTAFPNRKGNNKKQSPPGVKRKRSLFMDGEDFPHFDFKHAKFDSGYTSAVMNDAFYQARNESLKNHLHERAPVPRTHLLEKLLEINDFEHITAEVFHFLSGVVQSHYSNHAMADDVILCDCGGHVPVCFLRVFMHEKMRANELEKKLKQIEDTLKSSFGVSSESSGNFANTYRAMVSNNSSPGTFGWSSMDVDEDAMDIT